MLQRSEEDNEHRPIDLATEEAQRGWGSPTAATILITTQAVAETKIIVALNQETAGLAPVVRLMKLSSAWTTGLADLFGYRQIRLQEETMESGIGKKSMAHCSGLSVVLLVENIGDRLLEQCSSCLRGCFFVHHRLWTKWQGFAANNLATHTDHQQNR
ncbi:MAG: hypothetical protein OEX12_14355, partial [Gammaproteobacteria bacterium]|nr:hypothetical protein [Gammaproteobacteria bacterium]